MYPDVHHQVDLMAPCTDSYHCSLSAFHISIPIPWSNLFIAAATISLLHPLEPGSYLRESFLHSILFPLLMKPASPSGGAGSGLGLLYNIPISCFYQQFSLFFPQVQQTRPEAAALGFRVMSCFCWVHAGNIWA